MGGIRSAVGLGNEATIYHQPYGVVLIHGSRRPDFSTIFMPLISSIAAGNYTVIKPKTQSEYATQTLVEQIIADTLDPKRVLMVQGDMEFGELLDEIDVDMVFTRRREVTDQESLLCGQRNIPVKLHSAGWNVGIVSRSADIEQAAEMLVHNKFYKAGQNMDNLDVIYIHESIYKPFLIEAKNALYKFYTSAGDQNLNYGKITSSGNFNRLLRYLDKNDHNGQLETSVYHNERTNRINPIMIKNPDFDSRIMQDKIFGPILPLQTYSQLPELADLIDEHDHVENLFYFSENNYVKNDIKEMFNYQNLFFNCTNMPFDSVEFTPEYGKDATMNTALHGKYGFSSFSQQKLVYTARDPKSIAKKNFLKCKGIFLIDFF